MAENKESKQEVVARYRTEAIIAATRTVIAAQGPEFTLDQVAEKAGVAKGTLYLYFPSKDELVFTVLKNDIGWLLEKTREALGTDRPLLERMRKMVHDQFEFVSANRNIFLYYRARMGGSEHAAQKDFQCRMKEEYDQFIVLMTSHFEKAMAAGEIRPLEPRRLARVFSGTVDSVLVDYIIGSQETPIDEEVDFVLDVVLHGIAKGETE
jgi:TetR/AcrR family fatty acid metabolism transcriptional regulator